MTEKQFVHDGYIFHYSPKAIKSKQEVIGFYFDKLGNPQKIHRASIYGEHCIRKEKEKA